MATSVEVRDTPISENHNEKKDTDNGTDKDNDQVRDTVTDKSADVHEIQVVTNGETW